MKFNAHARMRSHPDFRVTTQMRPIDFDLGVEGSLGFALGAICAHAEAIPITLAVPFLRRRTGLQVIGSIGPLGLHLKPMEGKVRPAEFRIAGTLGKEGIGCEMEGDVGCETECDIKVDVPGKTSKFSIELGDRNESGPCRTSEETEGAEGQESPAERG